MLTQVCSKNYLLASWWCRHDNIHLPLAGCTKSVWNTTWWKMLQFFHSWLFLILILYTFIRSSVCHWNTADIARAFLTWLVKLQMKKSYIHMYEFIQIYEYTKNILVKIIIKRMFTEIYFISYTLVEWMYVCSWMFA